MRSIDVARAPIRTDVAIVGAGPVGLFQVFELGLLGLHAHLIDALPQPGGQCAELYPDKPIYDIPAVPMCTGRELTERLLEQIRPFAPGFTLGERVESLRTAGDDGFELATAGATRVHARAVVVAGGLGAFEPRRLGVDGADGYEGRHVHYAVRDLEQFRGKDVVVLGGGDSALDWALALQPLAGSVLLIHRSEEFRAAPASVAKMQALCEAMAMQFAVGQVTAVHGDGERLRAATALGRDGVARQVGLDELLVFYGLSPKLGPIAGWGLAAERNQIAVDTERFQTSTPGIYAVGDINTYPGKRKLILCGFHEATLAAFAIRERLSPGEKVHLQYTTTSPLMHRRLGIAEAA